MGEGTSWNDPSGAFLGEAHPRWGWGRKGGTWEEKRGPWALTCSEGVSVVVSNAFLTAAQPAVAGELQCPLWAVPAVPGELELALLDAALCPGCHAAGVDEIGLGAEEQVRKGGWCVPHFSPLSINLQNRGRTHWPAYRDSPTGDRLGMSPGYS